ncbi:MAG: hypothetical protein HKM93_19900 [Desulfobacteraceae bacterium]|nr:hypothetical protein [Desulfobacteraceae bacterium]
MKNIASAPVRCDIVLILISMTFLFSCANPSHYTPASPASPPEKINSLIVLPFVNISKTAGERQSVRNPLTFKMFTTGPVKTGADAVLTNALADTLNTRLNIEVIVPENVQDITGGLLSTSGSVVNERELYMEIGRHFKADAVIAGRLYRYVERVGTTYGIQSPASVAFDLLLLQTTDGSVVWHRHMDETQTSLTENLFSIRRFFKRRARWVRAAEMAKTGLDEMATEIEKRLGQPR